MSETENIAAGVFAKAAGQELVAKNNFDWMAEARAKAIRRSREFGSVTVDDLRGSLPAPHHQNAWGAIFKTGFRPIGMKRSTIKSNHARNVMVWEAL